MVGWTAGRVAVVTGAGRGIGRELALALGRLGATVVVADRGVDLAGRPEGGHVAEQVAGEIREFGGSALAAAVDVADERLVDELFATIVRDHGRIDIVVNAAGVMRRGALLEATGADLADTVSVHLAGAFNTGRAALRHWAAVPGSGRRMVNIGSDSGILGEPDYVCYAAAKAAVAGLTASSVRDMAAAGATCNLFLPQALTRMTEAIPIEELPDVDRWESGEFSPANVMPALLYVLSEDADWLNGCVIAGFGFEVHLYGKQDRVSSIHSPGPWDPEVLATRMRAVFEPLVDA